MNDDDWKEFETRVCEAIRLNLVAYIACLLVQIKSPHELWAKLESFYRTTSLTNK